MDTKVINKLDELIKLNRSSALLTIVESSGSSPRGSGSMMLVDNEGKLLAGTIGGGAVEEQGKKDAIKCILKNKSESFTYDLGTSNKTLGMICGGEVKVFIKPFLSSDKIIIVGAGHIGLRLSQLLEIFNYHVTIVDYRDEYANIKRFPSVDEVIAGDIECVLDKLEYDNNTSIVIATNGHKYDYESLKTVITKKNRYIGMIGSKAKIKITLDKLEQDGINRLDIEKVHSPIGLNTGGETPEEIALSILAEIQAVKYKRDGDFLKNQRR